jgi:hypothetical protein
MTQVNTKPNIRDVDGFYSELIAAHDGLEKAESDDLNARLVLILANHIGDRGVLRQAIGIAKAPSSSPASRS